MRRFVEGIDRGQATLFPECLADISDIRPSFFAAMEWKRDGRCLMSTVAQDQCCAAI
jgi:hypothetical protein